MKKLVVIILAFLLLAGCAVQDTFETIGDVPGESPALAKEIVLDAPENCQVIAGDDGRIYLCDGYEITVQTVTGADLESTFRQVSGFGVDDLTVMETAQMENSRYEWVWTAAGEGGDVVCRAVVLTDENFHYCVTVSAPAENAGELTQIWNAVLGSIRLR